MMREAGHYRMPVFEEDLDHIKGFVTAKDLWEASDSPAVTLNQRIRPIKYSPKGKPLEDLIVEMREEGIKMAVVIDEFGGTAGLATLGDLVQEIIGEVRDHDDPERSDEIVPLGDGTALVRGDALVRKVKRVLPVQFTEEDVERMSGFILRRLGRTARVGDAVKVPGGEFRVTRVGGHRIISLLFIPDPQDSETGPFRATGARTGPETLN
jgi:CBS domain containing-hemolysin-like protein